MNAQLRVIDGNAESRIEQLARAEQMLAEIASVEAALRTISLAEAARVMAKEVKLGTSAVNYATVIKLRAERKLAELVDAGQEAGEIATADRSSVRSPDTGQLAPVGDSVATLDDLGVQRQRLSEARKIRDTYSDEDLIERGRQASEVGDLLSRDRLIKEAGREKVEPIESEEEAAMTTTKEILGACRILAQRDRYLVSNFVSALPGIEKDKIRKQLRMAREAIQDIEKEIGK